MNRYVFILLYIGILYTLAEDASIPNKTNDLAFSYAQAAAYYELAVEAMAKSGKESVKFKKARDVATYISLKLASVGRTDDMAVNISNSRIEICKKEMLKEIDSRNENFTVLINKYSDSSLALINKPPKEVLDLLKGE